MRASRRTVNLRVRSALSDLVRIFDAVAPFRYGGLYEGEFPAGSSYASARNRIDGTFSVVEDELSANVSITIFGFAWTHFIETVRG